MRTAVNPPALPTPGGAYSQVVRAGQLVFVAGMVPRTAETRQPPEGIEAQTRQCLENLRIALDSVGAGIDDVCSLTAFLADSARDFAGYDKVCREYFATDPPARATVQAGLGDLLVEIQAIAVVE